MVFKMNRILLTGKNGQVGFELQRSLAPLGEIISLDRADCDLGNATSLRQAIRQVKPNVIVNAAAYTAVDRAETEPERAYAINALALGIIGEEAARLGALVVHYSTDYVFDGESDGYYRESAPSLPQNVYGRSKLAGEVALKASGASHLIFRSSWVFGIHGENFPKIILRMAAERDVLKIVADQRGAPTSAFLIADTTAHAIRQKLTRDDRSPDGIYHLAASGETNWYEYARHVVVTARQFGLIVRIAPDAILPIATRDYPTLARRPSNSRLDTSKLRQTFGVVLPPWQHDLDYFLYQICRLNVSERATHFGE